MCASTASIAGVGQLLAKLEEARSQTAREEPLQGVLDQQLRGRVVGPCADEVVNGVVHATLRREPGCGTPEHSLRIGLGLVEECVAHQPVTAEPGPLVVERGDEEVGIDEVREHARGAGRLQGGVAQLTGPQLERSGSDQQVALGIGQVGQHLGSEVVQDVTLVPARPAVVATKGQRGELQPRRPALGATPYALADNLGHHDPGDRGHQRLGLVRREAQVAGAQLGELRARPQPSQGQRWVGPGGDHHSERLGRVGDQELDRFVDPGVGERVVVVEDQHVGGRGRRQLVEQRR